MKHFDLTPLFRSSIGFDRMMDLFESVNRLDQAAPSYPPYNIEKTGEYEYRISLAVAGFSESDLEVEARENVLIVTGRRDRDREQEQDGARHMLHRGIAARAFERTFSLADHVRVAGAALENGLLHVDLVREIPEAMKPRRIPIGGANGGPKVIDAAAAA